MEKIRVALADDQILFVDSLKTVLELSAEEIDVVGIALNGYEAVELVREKQPDIILMDVRMPEMDGVEATRVIREEYPATQVMMLTTFDDDEYVLDALHNGAVGYILKNIPTSELVTSIKAIQNGTMQMSPAVAKKLVEYAYNPNLGKKRNQKKEKPQWIEELSEREKDVLRLVVEGFHNKEIAEKLFISEQTVKNHLSAVYDKLHVDSRAQVIHLISEYGVVL